MSTILPPNRTSTEEALELAAMRLDGFDVAIPERWNPTECPPDGLRSLAWTLSADTWRDDWPIARQREVVAQSAFVHKIKGTKAGVVAALEAMGYGRPEVIEARDFPQLGGPAADAAQNPLGFGWQLGAASAVIGPAPSSGDSPSRVLGKTWALGKPGHWADYMVRINKVIARQDADAIARRIEKVAPARSRLVSVVIYGVRHALGDGLWSLGQTVPLGGAFGEQQGTYSPA